MKACFLYIFGGMKKVYTFYQGKIDALSGKLSKLKRDIHLIGSARLLVVVGAVVCLWIFRQEGAWILTMIGAVFLLPFIGLMVIHNKLFRNKEYTETHLELNRNELKGLNYDYSAFDGAKELSTPEHSFGLDLDVFGDRSLFQSINRTVTFPGKQFLSQWFICPLTNKQQILNRQEAVKELSEMTEVRQRFYVLGKIYKGKQNDRDMIRRLMDSPSLFAKSVFWNVVKWVFPLTWLVVIVLVSFHLLPATIFTWLTLGCLLIALSQTKKVNVFHNSISKMEKILTSYSHLMKVIEEQPFQTEELKRIAAELTTHNQKASGIIKQLSGYLGKLDQRYNIAAAFVLNVLFLWDIRQTIQIEKWISRHVGNMEEWLHALGKFDALSSLATFRFNHPDYVFPVIADTYFSMIGKGLGHPLMHRDICVKNDIHIKRSPYFLIITGANMAGKSTYLRTVGVNYLLACVGAPVYADELTLYPAQLVTSLRTADSLVNNESYFFAELKRLKMIIDRLQRGEELFIILDEILKGTNSVDKQKGSIALMKQLISQKACGIIATHDLVLGTLEKEFPNEIKNFRFEADITDNELTFSYQLREGIAQNMNACFLMKKMGITI